MLNAVRIILPKGKPEQNMLFGSKPRNDVL